MEISWEIKFPGVFWPPAVMLSSRKFGSSRPAHHCCGFYRYGTKQCAPCNTAWHKPAFLWNTMCRHRHHFNTSSDNLMPPKWNKSFCHSAELSWDFIHSLQWKMHYLSCPCQSVALPFSEQSVKIHLAYCSETDLFISGLSFLAFVSSCCRELSNALPDAELARTEAFGLGISTGDRQSAPTPTQCILQTPSHLGRESTSLERNAFPAVNKF